MLEMTTSGQLHPGSTDELSSPTTRLPASGARNA
jgi:hypothetical protein